MAHSLQKLNPKVIAINILLKLSVNRKSPKNLAYGPQSIAGKLPRITFVLKNKIFTFKEIFLLCQVTVLSCAQVNDSRGKEKENVFRIENL